VKLWVQSLAPRGENVKGRTTKERGGEEKGERGNLLTKV
jgi:hypothetical protein